MALIVPPVCGGGHDRRWNPEERKSGNGAGMTLHAGPPAQSASKVEFRRREWDKQNRSDEGFGRPGHLARIDQAGARPFLLYKSRLEKRITPFRTAAGMGKGPCGWRSESTSAFTGLAELIREDVGPLIVRSAEGNWRILARETGGLLRQSSGLQGSEFLVPLSGAFRVRWGP